MTIDTGVAKLPGLPSVRVEDQALQKWIQAVSERLEVREGQRGNSKERAVTVRDLEKAIDGLSGESATIINPNGDLELRLGGMRAAISVQQFADAIRKTRLYRDLMKRLDDQSRFDDLPSEIRDVLLRSIAEEAALRGADIRRIETKIQDSNRSLAMVTEEITAGLGNNQAGIREVQAAYVNSTQATAVKVTQLESSLGDYYQDGTAGRVILEEQLTTQASFTEGLRGQYTLKIQAGGALAGFGLAAEEVNGTPSSAFLISADKFAIVSPSYSGGLTTNPSLNNIPFGVDASGVYINGQVRIDATGRELQQLSKSVSLTSPTNVFKQTASGAWSADTIVITANKLGGMTGTPAWTIVSGTYSGSLPAGNALTVSRASMGSDVVVFRATVTDDGFNFSDDITIAKLADGSNALTALLSNEAHSVSADVNGNVSSYTGSGTQIRLYEGATELNFDGSGTSNGTWRISASGSNITPGSISDSGVFATVGNHANFLTAAVTATIDYTITGKTAGGTSFSLTKTQSFSKSKTGTQGSTGATGATGSDGADGADGSNGARGSQTFYASGSSWSDATANNIVTSVTGSSTRIIGDTVIISNGSSFSETRYWSGFNWASPGVVIDGNLLVNGTISGSKIATNTLITAALKAGTSTTGVSIAGPNTVTDQNGNSITNGVYIYQNSQALYGLYARNNSVGSNGGVARFESFGGFTADVVQNGSVGLTSVGVPKTAMYAQSSNGGVISLGPTRASTGATTYAAYAYTGGYGPFTGAHDILIPKNVIADIGDIIVDVEVIKKKGISDVITAGTVSSAATQKGAVGILAGRTNFTGGIATFVDLDEEGKPVIDPSAQQYIGTHDLCGINSLGEGQVNVCGEGGAIAIGDLIVTSSAPGKGMKQPDDIIRSSTVAKAREAVTFSTPGEVQQIACIYLCG